MPRPPRKKVATVPSSELDPSTARPKGGQYSAWVIKLWTDLVVQGGVSLSAVQRILVIVGEALGLALPLPDYATGRSWILRLGLDSLRRPLEQGADWIWIADHSVQIGKTKLLVVVGLRAAHLPPVGQALRATDLHLIALVPMEKSNAITVHAALQQAAERTGPPRAIISDHGAD